MSEDRFETLRFLEAVLFAASEPLTEKVMAARLPEDADLKGLLEELKAHYANRGVNLMQFEGRWSFRTAPDLSHRMSIERKVVRKLTRAAVETLAIIAYHQPVTRAEIEEIRGVAISKGTLDSLLEAEWIKPTGRRETPGRPVTWGTTIGFLEHFSLESCEALPGMEELRAAGLLDSRSAISTLGTQGTQVLPPEGSVEDEEAAAAIELRGEPEAIAAEAPDDTTPEETVPDEALAEERLTDDAYEAELLARAEEDEETTGPFAPAEEREESIDPAGEEDDGEEDDDEEEDENDDDDEDEDDAEDSEDEDSGEDDSDGDDDEDDIDDEEEDDSESDPVSEDEPEEGGKKSGLG